MKVLEHTLSPGAEKAFAEISGTLKKPLVMRAVDRNHPASYGYTVEDRGVHVVHVQPALPAAAFEEALIHELLHCQQREAGDVGLVPRRQGDHLAMLLASTINSVVNDRAVEARLRALELKSGLVEAVRMSSTREALAFPVPDHLRDVFALFSAFDLVLHRVTGADPAFLEEVTEAYAALDDRVVPNADAIVAIIEANGSDTPAQRACSIRAIVEHIGWQGRFMLVVDGQAEEL
ncbi:MAG: hypothetical protein QHH05_02170 [Syntrophomonadaceae bacterium]|jgi:hypothetical protein|nr:hypothetical protein [Syntrophomonadaceae bacterium]MDH7497243.1 hypothetical protein [Syntrophomonadaceae bacterium]